MRVPCYFAQRVPDSRYSMWRFGCLTDKHAACPSGHAVVVGLDNELYVPEACGRVEIFDTGSADPALTGFLERAVATGYHIRKRQSTAGSELTEPDTHVEPFVLNPHSVLASTPDAPIFRLLAGPGLVFEADDGELYLRNPNGRWFHYLDERILRELRGYSR
jgi:hypothetical protein